MSDADVTRDDDFEDVADDAIELEMLDVTEGYFQKIEQTVIDNVGALERVKGNLMIHVPGVGTRTIITSGPRKGLYRDATEEDELHYVFVVPQWVLLHIVDPDPNDPIDLDALVEEGVVVSDGDPAVYERLMGLGRTQKNSLSIRMM